MPYDIDSIMSGNSITTDDTNYLQYIYQVLQEYVTKYSQLPDQSLQDQLSSDHTFAGQYINERLEYLKEFQQAYQYCQQEGLQEAESLQNITTTETMMISDLIEMYVL